MAQRVGTYEKGKNKGRQWEVYEDPASQTGWTRKEFDPWDKSNNGGPTEYFTPYNMAAAEVDDQIAQRNAAEKAAMAAARSAEQTQASAREAALRDARLKANERAWNEGVRQFNTKQGLEERQLGINERQGNRELDLRELDTRTRLKLGLRELQLREQEGGARDMRDREQNVMNYIQAIGRLRLPLPELQALSQRAVAGIIPGGAAPGAGGAPGALTADQWAALGQGVSRDYEQRQIGQGSGLRA